MRIAFLVLPLALATAACDTPVNPTLGGAVAGGALGAAVADDDNRAQGALIGAGVGALAGTLVGQANNPGDCIYRDSRGNQFTAPCSR